MSWLSSSFVTSALPPGSTNVSSSKTSLRPRLRSRRVGKLHRVAPARIDEEDPVVPAVCDHQPAGQRPG